MADKERETKVLNLGFQRMCVEAALACGVTGLASGGAAHLLKRRGALPLEGKIAFFTLPVLAAVGAGLNASIRTLENLAALENSEVGGALVEQLREWELPENVKGDGGGGGNGASN